MPPRDSNAPDNEIADSEKIAGEAAEAFEVHRHMVVWSFFSTLGLCGILAGGLVFGYFSALIAVAFAGALGGFLSALRRLYAFQKVFPADVFIRLTRRTNVYLVVYSLIPAVVGSIAAVVVYTLFASGLLEGSAFPLFESSGPPPFPDQSFRHFIHNYRPASDADYSKALVWSFVAGFSERFLPDILARLTSGVQDTKS